MAPPILLLRTLGHLSLSAHSEVSWTPLGWPEDADDVPLEPRRLLMLVRLAHPRPGELHDREVLAADFWPDSSGSAAGNALRQSLHYLRKRLGPGVLLGHGRSRVGVDPRRLRLDVAEFDEAIDGSRPGQAMVLYRGPFLHEAGPSGSEALDEWIEAERRRIERRATRGATHLAASEDLAHRPTAAAYWLRRGMETAPYDETLLRQRLRALLSRGDLGAGVAVFREAGRRFQADLGVDLSRETRRLMDELATETRPTGSAREIERSRELRRQIQGAIQRSAGEIERLHALADRTRAPRPERQDPAADDSSRTPDPSSSAPSRSAAPSSASGTGFDVVALASSAGGVNALLLLLAAIPADFPAAMVAVQHLDPHHRSALAQVLGRKTALVIEEAVDGAPLAAGRLLLAPPDHHLRIDAGRVARLSQTPAVQFVRPSADVLFTSVAETYGPRAIAVVLSGTGSDGAAGAAAVRRAGGVVLVQDPATSEFDGMPRAAVQAGCATEVLPLEEIAPALLRQLQPEAP